MNPVFVPATTLALLMLASAGNAQPVPAPVPNTQATAATDDPAPNAEPDRPEEAPVVVIGKSETVTCRREKPTGSRVAVKICRTEEAVREEQLATQEVMTELQLAGGPVFDTTESLIGADVDGNPQTVPSANPF